MAKQKERIWKEVAAAVQNFPIIYDMRYKSNNYAQEEEQAWQHVAKLVKRSATSCKNRWTALLFKYHSAVATKTLPSGVKKQLSFLDVSENELSKNLLDKTMKKKKNGTSRKRKPSKRRKVTMENGNEDTIKMENENENATTENENENISYLEFLKYTYYQSKNFPPSVLNKIKQKLFIMITDAELEVSMGNESS